MKKIIIILTLTAAVFGAEPAYWLDNLSLQRDSARFDVFLLKLDFSEAPSGFPVYAMTDPERIVIDLAGIKARDSVKTPEMGEQIIQAVKLDTIAGTSEINTRVSVVLKQSVHYTAYLSGNSVILTLSLAGAVKDSLTVYKADSATGQAGEIRSVEMITREKSHQITVKFVSLPQTSSIYMLDGPPRIIMDFYNAVVEKAFDRAVNLYPVKSFSVIKKEGEPPYAGILVYLDGSHAFKYHKYEKKIVVNIPIMKKPLWKDKKLMLISAGVVLTGGLAAGLLMGGEEEGGETPGSGSSGDGDLGAPPALPDP